MRPLSILTISLVAALVWAGCDNGSDGDGDADLPDGTPDADLEPDSDLDADAGDSEPDSGALCSDCHGADGSPAPPPGIDGSTDRAAPGVGAHEVHLADADWRGSVRCSACHVVPETVDAEGHIDEARPADVTFTGLATWRGTAERHDDGSCSVFCHGSFFAFNQYRSPVWTESTSSGLDCQGCHGMPPEAPHPQESDCGNCHIDMADATGQILIPYFHIDGVIQAPHQAHLPHLGGAGGQRYPCTECHVDDNYHGELRDGAHLDETTICLDCHAAGSVTPEDWMTYVVP